MCFKDIIVSKKKLMKRVENLCFYFKESMPKYKNSLKRPFKTADHGGVGSNGIDMSHGRGTKLDPSKPITACKVEKDAEGNIIYPIVVSPCLKILNLGAVEYDRPNYHSARNIFPIGFKSVREYPSMFTPNSRCDYVCEILDGGINPEYRVTCSEDPQNPIIKDTSSGAWIEICRNINELQGTQKKNIAVSGPD